jgi:PTH1 family peptidyl-tRNA hydrolase
MGDRQIVLAKPRTFMNLSGQAVQGLVHSYRVPPESLIVVYDDVDLPLGKLRIRPSGRAGGHNGMKSIIAALNTESFVRLRVGVGRPEREVDDSLVDHVLSGFSAAEEKVVQEAVDRACDALELLITDGVDAAMNEFN